MTTILITGIGGPAGRSLVEQLRGVRLRDELPTLVGADMADVRLPGLTMVAKVPAAADPEYPLAMRALIGRVGADLVIPTVQEELVQVAVLRSLLAPAEPEPRILPGRSRGRRTAKPPWVVIGDASAVCIAADKLLTMWALAAAGVPVPVTAAASAFDSTADALSAMGGAAVVKPRVSRGGRGVRLVERDADLPWWRADRDAIVQEFAPGTEYDAQVFRANDGSPPVVVVLEKTALREGRVGNATGVRRLAPGEAPEIAYVAERAVEALGLLGPVDIDIRRLASGEPVVLEINARFGANSAHAPELLAGVLRDLEAERARAAA